MSDSVSWLRLYHSILDNRKTGSLPDNRFGQWMRLLIIASRNTPRGQLPDDKTIKRYLGASYSQNPTRLKSLKAYFIQAGLIDKHSDGSLWVHNFTPRQWLVNDQNQQDDQQTTQQSVGVTSLDTFDENKGFIGESDTENHGTETEKDLYRGCAPLSPPTSWDSSALMGCIKQSVEELCGILASPDQCASQASTECSAGSSEEVCEEFTLTPPEASADQKKRILADKVAVERSKDYQSVTDLWNNLPGLMHHKAFNADDRKAFERALERFSLPEIKTAIERYSVWRVGASEGCYRDAYKWTFYEFLTRHKGGLIKRLSADDWEVTCKPFQDRRSQQPKPPSVKELLDAAYKRLH